VTREGPVTHSGPATSSAGATNGLRLALQRVERRLDPPQRNANGVWQERRSLELALACDAGAPGRGEAAPLPDYSSDSVDLAEAVLASLPAARLASLAEVSDPQALTEAVADLVPANAPAARFALESALFDRAARRAGRPCWQLLAALTHGAVAGPRGGPVALGALLPSSEPRAAVSLARHLHGEGVTSFKLKVGPGRLHPDQDATLAGLRAELGSAVQLRADANGSLSRDALWPTLERLGAHGVEFIEEPLAGAEPELLAGSPCPLALDESLRHMDLPLLGRWLALPELRVVVLKPTTLGGFGACVRLAREARARGRDAVVSHAFEGPIGWAACAHLALALGGSRAAGLWPLAHQSTPWPRIERGWLLPPAAPGLGGDR